MIITGSTKKEIIKALDHVNTVFDNNIAFHFLAQRDRTGKVWRLTLCVKDERRNGARSSLPNDNRPQERLLNACWHVHGMFIDALNHEARVQVSTGSHTVVVAHPGDPWIDRAIGFGGSRIKLSSLCDHG